MDKRRTAPLTEDETMLQAQNLTSESRIRRAEKPRAAEPVRVLMVGLDDATQRLVESVIQHDKTYAAALFVDIEAARAAIDGGGDKPTVILIESVHLRKRLAFPAFVHVIAIAGPDRTAPREVGADDIVRRPLNFEELRVRLAGATRNLVREHRMATSEILRDALGAQKSGEIIVSRGSETARIHVESGRIAWIHRPGHAISIPALLAAFGVAIDEATSRSVVEEGRATRRHFGDVLVDRGIVDRAVFRDCLKAHLRRELDVVLAWVEASATFVEDHRTLGSSFAFGDDEVVVPSRHRTRVHTQPGIPVVVAEPPAPSDATLGAWLDRMEAVPNVVACALLDPKNGAVLGSRGFVDATLNVAWSLTGSFAALGSEHEEILATTRTLAYLVRSALPEIPAVAVLCFDPTKLSPAMARIVFSKAASGQPLSGT